MKNIGSLYLYKERWWLLLPNKETVEAVRAVRGDVRRDFALSYGFRPDNVAVYWSEQLNCNVTYVSPNEIVVLLELDGKFKKVLSCNGKIGWTWFGEDYDNCFEEVNQ